MSEEVRQYLIRNVLQPAFPAIKPLDDVIGVCTQVDHIVASANAAIDQAYALLWATITDDPRVHEARLVLLAALGGRGSERQEKAIANLPESARPIAEDFLSEPRGAP